MERLPHVRDIECELFKKITDVDQLLKVESAFSDDPLRLNLLHECVEAILTWSPSLTGHTLYKLITQYNLILLAIPIQLDITYLAFLNTIASRPRLKNLIMIITTIPIVDKSTTINFLNQYLQTYLLTKDFNNANITITYKNGNNYIPILKIYKNTIFTAFYEVYDTYHTYFDTLWMAELGSYQGIYPPKKIYYLFDVDNSFITDHTFDLRVSEYKFFFFKSDLNDQNKSLAYLSLTNTIGGTTTYFNNTARNFSFITKFDFPLKDNLVTENLFDKFPNVDEFTILLSQTTVSKTLFGRNVKYVTFENIENIQKLKIYTYPLEPINLL